MTTVYGVPLSPYCRKLQLAFAYRGIDYDLVPTPPGSDAPEFVEASPLKKIPAVRTDQGHAFADSSVIIAYYEKIQADRPLYPEDAGDFARALFLEEFADTKLSEVTSALYFQKVLAPAIYGKAPDEQRVQELETGLIPTQLATLESLLPAQGWLVNDQYSIADVSVGALLINLRHAGYSIDAARYPRIIVFITAFLARADVQQQLAAEEQSLRQFAGAGDNHAAK